MDRLWDRLEQVPDHRTLKGRRYSLAAIVGISLAAMLSGANDLMAIFRWGRRLTPKGLAAFGIGRGGAPCHATYHYVFRSIAAADLERALRGSVPLGSAGHVAIDGKRLRGSQSENSPGIHVLQAFSTGLQASIGALAVPPDSAEVIEAIALLKDLPIGAGDVVTGDAAFTYCPVIAAIRAKGAGYFLFVKANQPELQAEIAHAFGDDSPARVAALPGAPNRRVEPPDLERAETIDKGHGRIEIRRIAVRPPPSRLDQNWPGLMRVCRIERIRELKTRCERQIIYAITDLPKQAASADRLLELSRAHWGIENRSFRVKDGTFAEDACRVRSRNAPIALAHLRDYTLALIRRRGGKPKPAREAFAANHRAAIRAILSA